MTQLLNILEQVDRQLDAIGMPSIWNITWALIFIFAGRWLARRSRVWFRKGVTSLDMTVNESMVDVTESLIYYGILLTAVFLALAALGIPIDSLLLLLGLFVLIIAVILQTSLNNLAATMIFVFFQVYKQGDWIGSRAGGVLGKLTFLYISFTEYLIIFGCPAGTQGFSGRYNYMEIWDFFLTGKTITYDLESEQIAPTILLPGDVGYLGKGHSLGVEIQAGSWMIEYGRGPNITALPFALVDSLVSSVELKSFWLTMKEYTRFLVKGLFKRS